MNQLDSIVLTLKGPQQPLHPKQIAAKKRWESAQPHERERVLKRASMPFENYLQTEVGRPYTANGRSLKIGQYPHQDMQMLKNLWAASVEHINDLGMPIPQEVASSYQDVKNGVSDGVYHDTLVDSYANHIADTVRKVGGMSQQTKKKKSLTEKAGGKRGAPYRNRNAEGPHKHALDRGNWTASTSTAGRHDIDTSSGSYHVVPNKVNGTQTLYYMDTQNNGTPWGKQGSYGTLDDAIAAAKFHYTANFADHVIDASEVGPIGPNGEEGKAYEKYSAKADRDYIKQKKEQLGKEHKVPDIVDRYPHTKPIKEVENEWTAVAKKAGLHSIDAQELVESAVSRHAKNKKDFPKSLRSAVEFIVDKQHVGTSDKDVSDIINNRMVAAKVYNDKDIKLGVAQALNRHKHNRDLYSAVMSGNLSGKRGN